MADLLFQHLSTPATPEKNLKKRKVDKDGFVCPLTPENGKSSTQFEKFEAFNLESFETTDSQGYEPADEGVFQAESYESAEFSGETVSSYFSPDGHEAAEEQYSDTGIEGQGYDMADHEQHYPMPTSYGDAPDQYVPTVSSAIVQNLMKDFNEESAQLFDEWSVLLRPSEEYEFECPQKLDQLIHEAENLEDELSHQKNMLCGRLQGIGQTLQLD